MMNNICPQCHNDLPLPRVKLKSPGVCSCLLFFAIILYANGFGTIMLALYVTISHSVQNLGIFEVIALLGGLYSAAIGLGFIIVGLFVHAVALIGARLDWIYQLQKRQVQLKMCQ